MTSLGSWLHLSVSHRDYLRTLRKHSRRPTLLDIHLVRAVEVIHGQKCKIAFTGSSRKIIQIRGHNGGVLTRLVRTNFASTDFPCPGDPRIHRPAFSSETFQ